ncbi:MAG: glycosyltransferase family 4 protein [Candidatus Eisenbacteria bacterium]
MKVLFIADGLESAELEESGSWLGELAEQLAQRGHRVSALCTRPLEPWQTAEAPTGVFIRRPSPEGLDSALYQALEQRPDIVHLAATTALSAFAVQSLSSAPLIADLHDFASLGPEREPPQRLVLSARVRVAHSAYARDRLVAGLGAPVAFVPYGVDALRFTPDAGAPLAPEVAALFGDRTARRVLFLGPPTQARGAGIICDLLVALHARVPGVELVVAGRDHGDPNGHSVLLTEARELGLTALLRLLPSVSRADLPALLASCHVAVAPGSAPEPGGLALMQALAAGLPVVAHPEGATAEWVGQGREGLLIPGRPVGTFAHSVAALLTEDATRAAYADRARLAAMERFDLERALFATEELYQEVHAAGQGHGAFRRRAA